MYRGLHSLTSECLKIPRFLCLCESNQIKKCRKVSVKNGGWLPRYVYIFIHASIQDTMPNQKVNTRDKIRDIHFRIGHLNEVCLVYPLYMGSHDWSERKLSSRRNPHHHRRGSTGFRRSWNPTSYRKKYIYEGVKGVKLESININGRYTSKEAIQRFIERKQNPGEPVKPKTSRMSQAEIDAGLRRHGIIR